MGLAGSASDQNVAIIPIGKKSITENHIDVLLAEQFTTLGYRREADWIKAKIDKNRYNTAARFQTRGDNDDLQRSTHDSLFQPNYNYKSQRDFITDSNSRQQ